MFSLPNDLKIDLSDLSSIIGIDGFMVEPGRCRAVVSKKFRLNSQDGPEIEASVGVKLVGSEADDGLLESITKYNDEQNKIKDDRRRDARRERSRKNSFEYRSPPKPPRTSHRASNGRGWSEQKAFRR